MSADAYRRSVAGALLVFAVIFTVAGLLLWPRYPAGERVTLVQDPDAAGQLTLVEDDLELALRIHAEVLEQHPEYVNVLASRAHWWREAGRPEAALADRREVVERRESGRARWLERFEGDTPTSISAEHHAVGVLAEALGRRDEALAAYELALETERRGDGHLRQRREALDRVRAELAGGTD